MPVMLMTGYYSNTYDTQQRQITSAMNTFLFAADLPDDTCEEDLYGFFMGYKMVTLLILKQEMTLKKPEES